MIEFRPFTEEEQKLLVPQTIDDMKRQQESLLGLMKHPGWAAFKAHIDLVQRQHLESMLKEREPHMITALRGSYLTARDLSTWPERQANGLGMAIKQQLDQLAAATGQKPDSGQ